MSDPQATALFIVILIGGLGLAAAIVDSVAPFWQWLVDRARALVEATVPAVAARIRKP